MASRFRSAGKKVIFNQRVKLLSQRLKQFISDLRPPHLQKTEFEKFEEQVPFMDYYVAIGHGIHVRDPPVFKVPNNMFIIFMTPAGYWGNPKDVLYDPKFNKVFGDRTKLKQLLQDTLPNSDKPDVITKKGWNWRNHVYRPGTFAPMHILEMYDHDTTSHPEIHMQYNNISGLYKLLPNAHSSRLFNGEKKTLKKLAKTASKDASNGGVLIVYGCRGDPQVPFAQMSSTFQQHMYSPFSAYNVPKAPNSYIQQMRNMEAATRIAMSKRPYNMAIINGEISRLPREPKGYLNKIRVNMLVNKYPNAEIKNYIRAHVKSNTKKVAAKKIGNSAKILLAKKTLNNLKKKIKQHNNTGQSQNTRRLAPGIAIAAVSARNRGIRPRPLSEVQKIIRSAKVPVPGRSSLLSARYNSKPSPILVTLGATRNNRLLKKVRNSKN